MPYPPSSLRGGATGLLTRFSLAAACTAAFAVSLAHADADNGERLARRWCAACHVVSPDQTSASADTPPFATIGRRPDFSAAKLALFLLEPHPKMPSMGLSRREAADLADYIAKLGK